MQNEDRHDESQTAPAALAARLVYARPQDLPSFPSLGLKPNGPAASAAASLGWTKKPPEPWKPDKSASASAAAVLAKDYKMAVLWSPTPSSDGAQAAMLAHKAARTSEAWKPTATEHGQSAATQAFKTSRPEARETQNHALNRQASLKAAKGAAATRPRSKSTPAVKESYPDEVNAAANALKAATKAHKPLPTAAAPGVTGPHTNMNRQMFTSNPLIKTEQQDKSREDELHATAVLLAKKIFTQQQVVIDQTKKGHASDSAPPRHRRRSSSSSSDDGPPMQFNSLHDAAYKLAQERLAKLQEEHAKGRGYQEYYGQAKLQRKFTVRAKLRRRASSDGALTEDLKQSKHIRNQMFLFSNKLSEVDSKKRQQDRDALMAAAQRNVQSRMKQMDQDVAEKTGMVHPTAFSQWEAKAHATAQSRSENRLSKASTTGQVNIGSGKYVTQDEVDAIAARRVQPLLDDINDKLEKEQARQTEARLDAERRKEELAVEKAREKELEEIQKKLKDQEKAETKEKRAEEKATKAEQKRLAKSKSLKRQSAPAVAYEGRQRSAENDTAAADDADQPLTIVKPGTPETPVRRQGSFKVDVPGEARTRSTSSSPKSPTEKVKTWFKTRFSRRGSKSDDDKAKDKNNKKGFVGGATLTGSGSGSGANNESASSADNFGASIRAIAKVGRRRSGIKRRSRSPSISRTTADNAPHHRVASSSQSNNSSSSSASDDEEVFRDEARDTVGFPLAPPATIQDPNVRDRKGSPTRDSRFFEMM